MLVFFAFVFEVEILNLLTFRNPIDFSSFSNQVKTKNQKICFLNVVAETIAELYSKLKSIDEITIKIGSLFIQKKTKK